MPDVVGAPKLSAWPHPRRLGCPLPRLGAIADGCKNRAEDVENVVSPKNEPTPKSSKITISWWWDSNHHQIDPNSSCSFYWVANTTPFHLPLREAPLVPGSFSSTGWVQGHVKSIKIMVSRGRLGLEPSLASKVAPKSAQISYVLYGLGLEASLAESSHQVPIDSTCCHADFR